jgi:hypothetical protein
VKRLSNEKNTLVAIQARNISHSIALRTMTRVPCMIGLDEVGGAA